MQQIKLVRLWLVSLLLTLAWSAPVGADADTLQTGLEQAKSALQKNDFATAIRTLEALDGQSGRWEVAFWLGTAYLLDGQLENAALTLDESLMLESEVADIWVQRAVVAQEQAQPEVALQLLEVAAQVDGSFPLTYLNAAITYDSLNDVDNARGAYGRFLKLAAESGGSNRMRRLRRDVLRRIAENGSGS